MEDKRRETGSPTPAGTISGGSSAKSGESPATEPLAPRRRGLKRKSTASISSSAPPKRHVREKAAAAAAAAASAAIGLSPFHYGPLTRARQLSDTNAVLNAVKEETAIAALRDSSGGDGGKVIEDCNEEFKAVQASVEAEFDAIRSCHLNSHVVPVAAGWFSWSKLHPLEKQTLPSFFNGESENRTPEVYMEIRNWIMKRFHANPNTNIDLKDLLALSTGDSDTRQEVLEFLDYWGLINYHPFLKNDTANTDTDTDTDPNIDDDKTERTNSSIENLFQFENELSFPEVLPRANAVQTMHTGLLRESAISEDFIKQEGPAVEYHCNSCSADCSRKRYHCQKQADFDLCTECFNNEKFGSGMSSSDFILMEPGEASSASGGRWTDQETLLLLEALELFKENWNEIAEHVATKTKAQCILHFLQMPIEDGFLDHDDTKDGIKEVAEPTLINNDASAREDTLEPSKDKMGEDNPDTIGSESGMDNSEPLATKSAKGDPVPTDISAAQPASTPINTSNLEETQDGKLTQEIGDSVILKALVDAFDAVGWPVTPQDNLCFAEAGNSVMALAAFLSQLVEPSLAMASAYSSLKSTSASSPGSQLAARHCYILEDPPDDKKEHTISDSMATKNIHQNAEVVTKDGENAKESMLNEENLTKMDDDNPSTLLNGSHSVGDQNDKKKGSRPVDGQGLTSADQHVLKDKPKTMKKLGKEKATIVKKPNETLPVSKKPKGGKSNKDKSGDADEPDEENSQVEEKQTSTTSTGQAGPKTDQSHPQKLDDSSSKDLLPLSSNDGSGNVNVASEVGQCLDDPRSIDVESSSVVSDKLEQQETLLADPVAGVESVTGEDKMQVDKSEDLKPLKTGKAVDDDNVAKLKRAALATLSAAAVKAKLLADQEEDEIKQLATVLIEKQLRKLEIKLSFFTEMEGSILRVRELLERSRQKVSAERSLLIASRLGGPGRGMGSSHPLNRMPPGLVNRMNMAGQRPPMARPVMGSVGPTMNSMAAPEVARYGAGQSMAGEKPSPAGTD